MTVFRKCGVWEGSTPRCHEELNLREAFDLFGGTLFATALSRLELNVKERDKQ